VCVCEGGRGREERSFRFEALADVFERAPKLPLSSLLQLPSPLSCLSVYPSLRVRNLDEKRAAELPLVETSRELSVMRYARS